MAVRSGWYGNLLITKKRSEYQSLAPTYRIRGSMSINRTFVLRRFSIFSMKARRQKDDHADWSISSLKGSGRLITKLDFNRGDACSTKSAIYSASESGEMFEKRK